MSSAELAHHVAVAARAAEPQIGLQTRTKVLREATVLFADRGFQGTTIRDIALTAGVNVAAVNYYFRSKEDLYRAVMETALAEWTSEVIAGDCLSPDDGLEKVIRTIIAALVSPVIDRAGNEHLLRLVAWGMLQNGGSRVDEPMRSFPLVVAQLLNPFLPDHVTSQDGVILAQWLVGQCLLISPVLAQDGAAAGDQSGLIDRLTGLALGGLNALRGPGQSPTP